MPSNLLQPASLSPRWKIALTAHNAYPLFDPTDASLIGGIETRAWLFARGLAERPDCEVHVLVRAPRRFLHKRCGNLHLWNVSDGFDLHRRRVAAWREGRLPPNAPLPYSLLWDLPLLAALKIGRMCGIGRRMDRVHNDLTADCYLCFGVSRDSQRVIDAAHQRGKAAVVLLASQDDLNPGYAAGSPHRSPTGEPGSECHRVLSAADAIVAQTPEQARLLTERFGRTATVIPNPFDHAAWAHAVQQQSPTLKRLGLHKFILWIGRADQYHKRPLIALELARRLPQVSFLLVLNPQDSVVSAKALESAPPNVVIIDRIPFTEIPAVIARARALLSTAAQAYEGLPNVFLQAAASGLPILSLEVDAGFVQQQGAGCVTAGSLEQLAAALQRAWIDEAWCASCGSAGHRWVVQNHDLAHAANQLTAVIRSVSTATAANPQADSGQPPGNF